MVPCPFCSHSSKKQLRVFRKKVTVLKDSCLRAAEIENVAVRATGKRQVGLFFSRCKVKCHNCFVSNRSKFITYPALFKIMLCSLRHSEHRKINP
jgi:hypothetical protein